MLELLEVFRSALANSVPDRASAFDWLDDLAALWQQARPAVDRFADDDGRPVICRRTDGG